MTIVEKIIGTKISDLAYYYVFEPLYVELTNTVSDDIDVWVQELDINTGAILSTQFATNLTTDNNNQIVVDYMAVLKSFITLEPYKIGSVSDILDSKFVLGRFNILTGWDGQNYTSIAKIVPLLGARMFDKFSENTHIRTSTPLTEFEYLNLENPKFKGYPIIDITLQPLTNQNIEPTITITTPSTGSTVCGAFLIWKSIYGGWVSYGFEIISETTNTAYNNDLDMNLIYPNDNGNPFLTPNYTNRNTVHSLTLKAISVERDIVLGIRGIEMAPVIYLMRSATSGLELMRLDSFSAPLDNLKAGETVSISLTSIHQISQNLR